MIFFITLFSQVLKDFEFPMPCLSDGKCVMKRWPIFKLFPVSKLFYYCPLLDVPFSSTLASQGITKLIRYSLN